MHRLLPFTFSVLVSLLGLAACSGVDPSPSPSRDPGAKENPQAGRPWVIDECGGFCSYVDKLAEDPNGKGGLWLTLAESLGKTLPCDPVTDRLTIDENAWTRSVVGMNVIGASVVVSLAGMPGRPAETVAYAKGTSAATVLFPWPARRIERSDNGCIAAERSVSTDVGTEVVVRGADVSTEKVLPLPHYHHWPLFMDAMVGLTDSLLVLADRNEEGRGALYRVSCPSLTHELVARGEAVASFSSFVRGVGARVWSIHGSWETRRLVYSDDGGVTWTSMPQLSDFVAARIATHADTIVVAGAKMKALAYSLDAGATWQFEAIESFSASLSERSVSSVLVAADGTVHIGGECNTLIHRRLPLRRG